MGNVAVAEELQAATNSTSSTGWTRAKASPRTRPKTTTSEDDEDEDEDDEGTGIKPEGMPHE